MDDAHWSFKMISIIDDYHLHSKNLNKNALVQKSNIWVKSNEK